MKTGALWEAQAAMRGIAEQLRREIPGALWLEGE